MYFYTHTGLLTLDRGPLFSKGKEKSGFGGDGKLGRKVGRVEEGQTAVGMYYMRKEKTKKIRYSILNQLWQGFLVL